MVFVYGIKQRVISWIFFCKAGFPNWARVDPQGSIARVHVVSAEMCRKVHKCADIHIHSEGINNKCILHVTS